MTRVVRTVLGDIAANELGVTYAHEHLIIDSPLVAERWPDIHLPSVDDAVAELDLCRNSGVRTVVDAMPIGAGGDIVRLGEISRRAGINVVAATGLHTARYYEDHPWSLEGSTGQMAAKFISDVDDGYGRTDFRAGIIKVATIGPRVDERERRLFRAAAISSRATGAAILTHCEDGLGGVEQVSLLLELGTPPDRVILSHTDKVTDPGYHRELLASGVNVEYDQSLRQAEDAVPQTATLIARMCEEGFGSHIMLGTDGARRSLWASLGGSPGLAWLATGFVEILREHGVAESQIQAMLVENPARVLPLAAST